MQFIYTFWCGHLLRTYTIYSIYNQEYKMTLS